MAPSKAQHFVVWVLDARHFALPVAMVERVLPAMAMSPLPGAPRQVSGCVNVRGKIVPVLDLRQVLALPPKELMIHDHLVLVRSGHRRAGFFADAVQGVVDRLDDAVPMVDALDRLLDAA